MSPTTNAPPLIAWGRRGANSPLGLGFGSLTFLVLAGFVSVAGEAPLASAALASVASFFVSYGPCSVPPTLATIQNRPLTSFLIWRAAVCFSDYYGAADASTAVAEFNEQDLLNSMTDVDELTAESLLPTATRRP